jgi:hypothetical protein
MLPLKLEIDELKLHFHGDYSSFSKVILMATSAICAGLAETGRVKLEAVLEIVGKIWMKTRGIKWAGK